MSSQLINFLVPMAILLIQLNKQSEAVIENSSSIKWKDVDVPGDGWKGIKKFLGKDPCADNMKICNEIAGFVKTRIEAKALRKACEPDAMLQNPNKTFRTVCWIRQKEHDLGPVRTVFENTLGYHIGIHPRILWGTTSVSTPEYSGIPHRYPPQNTLGYHIGIHPRKNLGYHIGIHPRRLWDTIALGYHCISKLSHFQRKRLFLRYPPQMTLGYPIGIYPRILWDTTSVSTPEYSGIPHRYPPQKKSGIPHRYPPQNTRGVPHRYLPQNTRGYHIGIHPRILWDTTSVSTPEYSGIPHRYLPQNTLGYHIGIYPRILVETRHSFAIGRPPTKDLPLIVLYSMT
ncbi:hypothetical protein WDU94_010064 [Cyamophila willieti]